MKFIKITKNQKEIFEKMEKAKKIYGLKTNTSLINHLLNLAIEGNKLEYK